LAELFCRLACCRLFIAAGGIYLAFHKVCRQSASIKAAQREPAMKKPLKRKEKSLADQHAQLFVPISYVPINSLYDLRQPDFRPMIISVVAGGAAEQPIESWSNAICIQSV
jgi:hypothetical protein